MLPLHCSTKCTTTPDGWWPCPGGVGNLHQRVWRSCPGIWDDPDPDGRWQPGSQPWGRQVGKECLVHQDFSRSLWKMRNKKVIIVWIVGERETLSMLNNLPPAFALWIVSSAIVHSPVRPPIKAIAVFVAKECWFQKRWDLEIESGPASGIL